MERCDECRFWQRLEWKRHHGFCKIKLPPFYLTDSDSFTTTAEDEGCDLGQPHRLPEFPE